MVGRLGISRGSRVVVYGSNLTETARIWWTLKYLGLENVTILNGGWQAWTKEKLPVDAASPKVEAVKFEPKFPADRLEEIGSLKKAVQSGKVTVVDARSRDEFTAKTFGASGAAISPAPNTWNGRSCWVAALPSGPGQLHHAAT